LNYLIARIVEKYSPAIPSDSSGLHKVDFDNKAHFNEVKYLLSDSVDIADPIDGVFNLIENKHYYHYKTCQK
jgi:hypothetical protein